jgi:hypothetical protein
VPTLEIGEHGALAVLEVGLLAEIDGEIVKMILVASLRISAPCAASRVCVRQKSPGRNGTLATEHGQQALAIERLRRIRRNAAAARIVAVSPS